MSKSIDEMSAEELFALAQQKQQQEEEQQREARSARIEELKEQRKNLIAEHKKAVAAIDKELKELGARVRSSNTATGGRGRSSSSSNRLLEIIAEKGKVKSTDLRQMLEAEGVDTKNLGQQLAYLKRKRKVKNPGRGVYAIVK